MRNVQVHHEHADARERPDVARYSPGQVRPERGVEGNRWGAEWQHVPSLREPYLSPEAAVARYESLGPAAIPTIEQMHGRPGWLTTMMTRAGEWLFPEVHQG